MINIFKKLFGKKEQSPSSCCGGGCCGAKAIELGLTSEEKLTLAQSSELIVIGKIIEKKDHPDPKMTKVKVCQVDLGGETEQILCGGTNTYEGQIVATAKVGTKLSPEFEIGERDIRGQVSRGMICAKSELGLSQEEEKGSIWDLPKELESKLGTPIKTLV